MDAESEIHTIYTYGRERFITALGDEFFLNCAIDGMTAFPQVLKQLPPIFQLSDVLLLNPSFLCKHDGATK